MVGGELSALGVQYCRSSLCCSSARRHLGHNRLALLALATLVIAALLGRTLFGIGKGELRTLSTGRTAWLGS